ncbi:TIGR04282 family arsenosugar biosynthesis glycosyltransferase [Limnofasciculus baicalensis]|uniref:TIGR04282 family arsenosugar biosynthesis glycosyltransferase n=1 Tax=Limnofasciculus baicalensis BBK-W-15 TaxID=2699891 RepID=A0AAE3GRX8_9CYAN|nr:TIGR04282 family arsenosugar biosynthesis glycosyltransferase [Limnofasciculus baicalensis]MCP2729566.1 TIGR04282 family arsenosugar biosynthesis glycosyltransferase [Limnofasciculus baicalensis BBK-W-15]
MISERLIIFTRYPQPGKTKTRLIPILGAEGAANFQRQMTEYTITEVKSLVATHPLSIEVHFAGGNVQLMETWLGGDIIYRQQGEGDLGRRMMSAFDISFAAGMSGAIIIGTDCLDLNAKLMDEAFQLLSHNDLVLGPAADGGYYLIGLRRLIPELFVGIDWGTSQVRQQTIEIAQTLNLAIAYLPILNDIDRPEDLDDGLYKPKQLDRIKSKTHSA